MDATLTADEARQLRADHDRDAGQLARKSQRELGRIAAGLRAGTGWERLYGTSSKDELISEILGHRYPAAKLNEAIHVMHHRPGESWTACEWCHPHSGATCECPLREGPVSGPLTESGTQPPWEVSSPTVDEMRAIFFPDDPAGTGEGAR